MSAQLSAELKKKIIDKANDYEWEDNPEAVRSAYIDGATDYAELLAEAQERIKTLEAVLSEIANYNNNFSDFGNWLGCRQLARKALSPDNKLKEDDHPRNP